MLVTDEELEAVTWEAKQSALAFHRVCVRRARLKRELDCGHWIDGSEPYRYQVWRVNDMPRGTLVQRTDCESCARIDSRY